MAGEVMFILFKNIIFEQFFNILKDGIFLVTSTYFKTQAKYMCTQYCDDGKFHMSRFIQARLCKIQGLLKDFPTVLRTENLRKILI